MNTEVCSHILQLKESGKTQEECEKWLMETWSQCLQTYWRDYEDPNTKHLYGDIAIFTRLSNNMFILGSYRWYIARIFHDRHFANSMSLV